MKLLEAKEDGITVAGQIADESTMERLYMLSLLFGEDIQETCDRINQFLQTFTDLVATIAEKLKSVFEMLTTENEGICELRRKQSVRKRHGYSSGKCSSTGKYFIKWSEKYRSP